MPRSGIYCTQLRATQQAKTVAGRSSGCPHPSWLALNRAHAVGVGWGCTIPSGASLELDHRPRAQPAPICCQESKGAAFVPRVGCSNRPGGRRRPDSSDRRIDRDQSTKASKRVGPAAGFLLVSARDLRFSPRAIQQGNVGLLGTRNGITRSLGRRVKTPDSSRSYADPVLSPKAFIIPYRNAITSVATETGAGWHVTKALRP